MRRCNIGERHLRNVVTLKGATTVLTFGGPSAEGGEAWGGGVPLPTGKGSGEGADPPPQKIFCFFLLKMVSFGAFWVALPHCM